MLIRHAEPARDAAACAAIYAPYVRDSVITFEEDPPDAEEFVRRIKAASVRYPWLVAEEDGAVAGYAYASRYRERAAYRWAADVAIYVGEAYQGRGIGKALYSSLLHLLARQGIRTVCAGITLPNPASIALHESCGFLPVGVFRRIGYKNGGWRDVGWWQRALASNGEDPPAEPGRPAQLEPPA